MIIELSGGDNSSKTELMFREREVVHASTDDVKVLKAAFMDRMITEINVWDKEEELSRKKSLECTQPRIEPKPTMVFLSTVCSLGRWSSMLRLLRVSIALGRVSCKCTNGYGIV